MSEAADAPIGAVTETPASESPPAVSPLAGSPLGAVEGEAEKPEASLAPEGEGEPKPDEGLAEAPPPLTPDSYQFKLPDGVTPDEATLTSLKETLATSQVPAEVGQKLIDMHVAELNKSAEAFAQGQAAAWTTTVDQWKSEVEADPELGGDKKPIVTAAIARALDEYGDPSTRQAFDLTGVGWNPHVIKFIYRMAAALNEGSPHPASGAMGKSNRTPGDILYPDPS